MSEEVDGSSTTYEIDAALSVPHLTRCKQKAAPNEAALLYPNGSPLPASSNKLTQIAGPGSLFKEPLGFKIILDSQKNVEYIFKSPQR